VTADGLLNQMSVLCIYYFFPRESVLYNCVRIQLNEGKKTKIN